MHHRVEEDLPRTNNELEGWHTRFAGNFTHAHGHIWKFIEKLKLDSHMNHFKIAQGLVAIANPPHKRVYRELNGRIRTLVAGYQNNNFIDFLRGISYNLA